MANSRLPNCPHLCINGAIQTDGPGPDDSREYPCPHCNPTAVQLEALREEYRRLKDVLSAVEGVLVSLRDKRIDTGTACYRIRAVLSFDDPADHAEVAEDDVGLEELEAADEILSNLEGGKLQCGCATPDECTHTYIGDVAATPRDTVVAEPSFEDLRAAKYLYLLKLGALTMADCVSHFAVIAPSVRGETGLHVECTHGGWTGRLWYDPQRGLILTINAPSGPSDIRVANATPTADRKLNPQSIDAWLTGFANRQLASAAKEK